MEVKDLEGVFLKHDRASEATEYFVQPSSFKKCSAFFIDLSIVFFFRSLLGIPLFFLLLRRKLVLLKIFMDENSNLTPAELLGFMSLNGFTIRFLILLVVVIFIGSFYYVVMFTMDRQGTVGFRVVGCKMVCHSNFSTRLSFGQNMFRYMLSLIPMLLPLLLYALYMTYGVTIKLAILFLVFLFWYEVSLFLKVKRSAHDLIANTAIVSIDEDGEVITKRKGKSFFQNLTQF